MMESIHEFSPTQVDTIEVLYIIVKLAYVSYETILFSKFY